MRFVCDSCRAQYMISDEKVGPKGVKVRCKKCGYVILVKKADGTASGVMKPSAPPPAPVQTLGDADDAMATQVMQNPLTGPVPTGSDPELTNPGASDERTQTHQPQNGFLGGVDEDEIGAVFDQVLNSGAHSIPKEAKNDAHERTVSQGTAVGDDDDRMSTRVLDASVVKKLAEESGSGPGDESGASVNATAPGTDKAEVPRNDWFVAIDDKQTGPLTLDKIKEHWERGEVGPDSLCWRAGFSDWIPLSEVTELAAELAPRPKAQPMIVSSPQTVGSSVPNLVSVPVESAFSAGGVMKSVRGEMHVPMAAAAPEETGSWRPSAASALASLVKDEMDALAKPAPKKHAAEPLGVGENLPSGTKGLLDLPPSSENSTNGRSNGQHAPTSRSGAVPSLAESQVTPSMVARGPANPYIANPGATYSSPGVSQYRPSSNRNVTLAIIVGGAVAVLALVVVIVYLVTARQQQPVVVQPQTAVVPPVAVAAAQPVAVAQPTAAQPTVAPPVVGQPAVAQPAVGQPGVVQPAAGQPAVAQALVVQPTTPAQPIAGAQPTGAAARPTGTGVHPTPRPMGAVAKAEPAPRVEKEKPEPVEKSKPIKEVGGGDDDFAKAFGDSAPAKKGGGSSEKAAPADEAPKKKTVFIPDAPGQGGNIPESLGSSDVMEVVLANKPGIAKCVEDQRKKEPGLTGKLVMKWTIQTSGKTSNVQVASEEFKSNYIAGCVGGLIKTWTFPRHKTQGDPVVFPFKF